MRIVIEKAPLLKALSHVHAVVARRETIPILSNVLLHAEGEGLSITGTDMDVELVERIAATVHQNGKVTVPARILHDIVRKLRDGAQIELELVKHELKVRSGRSLFAVATLPADDFPSMVAADVTHGFVVAAVELRTLIDHTKFAISNEETRYYLNGIYLHVANRDDGVSVLRSVATDGHRLARAETDLPEGAAGMPGVIVPRKATLELRKLIDGQNDVSISLGTTKIVFGVGAATMTSKLIDGTFPDYDRVIPKGNNKIAEVPHDDFSAAIDRVATISVERTRAVKMTFTDGNLNLLSRSPENGEATEDVEISYGGPPIDVGFNAKYLLDILGEIDGDVRFELENGGAPAVIRDAANAAALYVLMPMRV